MTPYGLTTEQRVEPLGVGELRPRLSWKLDSERRGAAQSAYRITATEGDSARLTVTVTMPPGSTALLEIPTPDPGRVRESDVPAVGRPGVLGAEPSAAGVTLRLTSGRFTFTATPA